MVCCIVSTKCAFPQQVLPSWFMCLMQYASGQVYCPQDNVKHKLTGGLVSPLCGNLCKLLVQLSDFGACNISHERGQTKAHMASHTNA